MWPKRKLKLFATPVSQGLAGFQALLQAVGLDYTVMNPDVHIQTGFCSIEKFEEDIFTDLVIWPDVPLRDDHISRGRALGQSAMLPEEFLARLWQTELVFPVPSSPVVVNERPVLWAILREAGYSPSLLWDDEKGSWLAERGQGLGWVVSGSWLTRICGETVWSRPKRGPEATWIVREDRTDFYYLTNKSTFNRTSNPQPESHPLKVAASAIVSTGHYRLEPRTSNFVGCIPRWKEPLEEQVVCQGIAQALELGVSWFDIKRALSPVWQNIRQEWQLNDFGWVQGPGGTELPSQELNDMENRRAG